MAYEVHSGSVFSQGMWTGMMGPNRPPVPVPELFAPGLPGALYAGGGYANVERNPVSQMPPPLERTHMQPALRTQMRNCPLGEVVGNEVIMGVGVLTWLSSKAGLITAKANKFTVSFQLKHFCDQGVSDLTAVLRPGFTLLFQAIASESNDWIATNVSPLHGMKADEEFVRANEVDLEAAAASLSCGPPRLAKDMYSCDLELRAIPMLLSIFQRHALPHCQLSSLHSQISNCGDDELYRYVGTSSLKRRQYLERRTHLFIMTSGDQVYLQSGGMYQAVLSLARYLLRRGGVTSTYSLYNYFTSCPDVLIEAREMIGDGRAAFLSLLMSHPWIFAVFPARDFVSIRRNLPHYDYCAFLSQNFPDCELLPPPPGAVKGTRIAPLPAISPQLRPPPMLLPASISSANPVPISQMTRCVSRMPYAFEGDWPSSGRTASSSYWRPVLPITDLPPKPVMLSTSTQTCSAAVLVDSCSGPDDSMQTRCEACGASAVASNELQLAACYSPVQEEERLYNPFHSFDLASAATRFSALDL